MELFPSLSQYERGRKFIRMEKPAETTTPIEEKHSINRGFVVWPFVILLFYALSSGPVMTMQYKGRHWHSTDSFVLRFYSPLMWAYWRTPLHKPLGMYFHLWSDDFEKNGNKVRSYW